MPSNAEIYFCKITNITGSWNCVWLVLFHLGRKCFVKAGVGCLCSQSYLISSAVIQRGFSQAGAHCLMNTIAQSRWVWTPDAHFWWPLETMCPSARWHHTRSGECHSALTRRPHLARQLWLVKFSLADCRPVMHHKFLQEPDWCGNWGCNEDYHPGTAYIFNLPLSSKVPLLSIIFVKMETVSGASLIPWLLHKGKWNTLTLNVRSQRRWILGEALPSRNRNGQRPRLHFLTWHQMSLL